MANDDLLEELCTKLLTAYGVVKAAPSQQSIQNIKVYRSGLYGRAQVIGFTHLSTRYYASDDYSLDDNPKFIEEVFRDIDHILKGHLLRNPTTQQDGAIYAAGIDDTEYYLWQCQ